jgi:hypothetical protein
VALAATPGAALRMTAGLALTTETGIHVALAPDHLREIPYIGGGFVAASLASVVVLVGVVVFAERDWTWWAGSLLCLAMASAFAASRTVGLPGFREGWTSDSGLGLVALAAELTFVLCALNALPPIRLRNRF